MTGEITPGPVGPAESLVAQAGLLARWATRTGTEIARLLPGAAAVQSELEVLERTVLGELRRRLDNIDPLPGARPEDEPEQVRPRPAAPPPKQTEPLRVAMAELLSRSVEQTAQRAREYQFLAILRQLLPDEARILAALSDGTAYPLVHVDCRTGVSTSRRLLSNASTVGRGAGVAVPAAVPRYLSHLRGLDLVELGEADPALGVQYDILLTDPRVRAAEDAARAEGRPRIVRLTVRISEFGRDLWDACHPRATEGPDVVLPPVATAPVAGPVVAPAAVPDPGAAPRPGAPPAGDGVPGPVPVPPHLDVISRNGAGPG